MVDAEGGAEAGGASGGHYVAGSSDVVPHDLWRKLPQEETAGVFHPSHPGPGVGDHQAEVLRRHSVGQLHRLSNIRHQYRLPLARQGAAGQLLPRHTHQLPFQLLLHTPHQLKGGGHQDGRSHGVVLGLGDEIGGAKGRVSRFVGDEDGLRGAEDAVNVHLPLHQLLGVGDQDIARPADFVHPGDRLGAKGHGRNGRDTSNLVYGIDSSDLRRQQHRRVQRRLAPPWRGQDDFAHAGDAGRYGRHQHRGRIGRGAARRVQAHPL